MLRIIYGVPGSGKSYYAVYYICKHYATYDKLYETWILDKDVLLVTNIDSLKLSHIPLDLLIHKHGLDTVFSVAFWDQVRKKEGSKKIIMIIDEAQKYFHRKFYNKEVFFFFQYHRHLGIDIFLITQDYKVLPPELINLTEFLIYAKPRSFTIGRFVYEMYTTKGEKVSFKTLPRDKLVFRVYKSFDFEEAEKPPNFLMRYALSIVVLFISLFVVSSLYVKYFFFSKAKSSQEVKASKKVLEKPHVSKSHFSISNSYTYYLSELSYIKIRKDLLIYDGQRFRSLKSLSCLYDPTQERLFCQRPLIYKHEGARAQASEASRARAHAEATPNEVQGSPRHTLLPRGM